MTTSMNVSRRTFMAGAGAAGLVLGFRVPLSSGGGAALAGAGQTDEITAWVVVRPDETVVIRIARSEMGQGTLTGLAQLVAEELDCDWARVTTEYPTPGTNLARGKIWKSFATGGSRGIRGSHDYVREGGAAARQMLVTAAANAWGVSPGDCTTAK
ncbi:MAG: molybdopterin cofactor-binding domain-containing protein, partial [Alphaproteobacteria bacterium]